MRTLYHLTLSPFCRTVRLLLAEKGLEFEKHVERVWEERDAFMKMNPAGDIPVFVDEGRVIVQHYAICEYLEEAYPEQNFMGTSIMERAEVRRLISWFDLKFNEEVSKKLVFEKIFKRYYDKTGSTPATIREGLSNLSIHLDYISWIIERQNWLAGPHFSLADITAAAHLSCVDYVTNIPWEQYPVAKEWYVRIKSRRSFRDILTDIVAGHNPSAVYGLLDF